MLITEFRIPLPLTLEEFQCGQLYTIIEMSKNETGNEEGVEILKNEPYSNNDALDKYNSGQHTYKLYHIKNRLPNFIQNFTSMKSLIFHEESWNAFPLCKTEVTAPDFVDEGFSININTVYQEDNGCQENVHGLPNDLIKRKCVVYIDIANDSLVEDKINNPKTFKSSKTGRGPISTNWIKTTTPIMTCYILVTCEFKWFSSQTRVESLIYSTLKRLFFLFYRMLFCSMDKWYGLTMTDLREFEKQGAIDLHVKRFQESVHCHNITE